MSDWLSLNPDVHAQAGWRRFTSYAFAAREARTPVLMAELTQVLPWYPLAFVPRPERAPTCYHLVALLAPHPGQNLYLAADGRWLAPYVPSQFRAYPFALGETGGLAIDRASGLFADPAAAGMTRFYGSDGGLTETTARIIEFLQQRRDGLVLTQRLVDQLAAHGLLAPWPLRWQPTGSPETIDGLWRVDEERLRTLAPGAYAELAHSGALGLAYAQLFSEARIGDLHQRARRQPTAADAGLDQGEELTFRFDS